MLLLHPLPSQPPRGDSETPIRNVIVSPLNFWIKKFCSLHNSDSRRLLFLPDSLSLFCVFFPPHFRNNPIFTLRGGCFFRSAPSQPGLLCTTATTPFGERWRKVVHEAGECPATERFVRSARCVEPRGVSTHLPAFPFLSQPRFSFSSSFVTTVVELTFPLALKLQSERARELGQGGASFSGLRN